LEPEYALRQQPGTLLPQSFILHSITAPVVVLR
jgi:hypothetical protein